MSFEIGPNLMGAIAVSATTLGFFWFLRNPNNSEIDLDELAREVALIINRKPEGEK
jgi:hypothetical protein